MSDKPEEGIRLQKVLAQAGLASRRAAEEMIAGGRVEVNGELVIEQGRRVDPEHDEIRVDGSRIPTARRHVYYVLNKPRGVISTMDDPEGRPDLSDLEGVPHGIRLFHVGRLDTETSGLILLTNDGEFANRMTHPSYEVLKTYLADVEGRVDHKVINRLSKGITLEDGPVHPDSVKLVQAMDEHSLVQVTLHEGRNRIVRRMMDSVAHPARRLSRTSIGPVHLGKLGVGDMRPLTREELGKLYDIVGL